MSRVHLHHAEYDHSRRREILAPLQQAEAIDIRRKSDSFGEKVEEFRKFFQQKAPFSVPGGELKLEHVSFDTSQIRMLQHQLQLLPSVFLPECVLFCKQRQVCQT